MTSNFDFLIQNYMKIFKYPILISIIPLLVGALIYFFGKIRSSNLWQYHLDEKYIPFLHGIIIINNFVFNPIIELIFLYLIITDWTKLINFGFASIVFLIFILNRIYSISNKILIITIHKNTERKLINKLDNFNKLLNNIKTNGKLFLAKQILPLLFYFSIYLVLIFTESKLIFLLIGFIWLLGMMYFANTDTLIEQQKKFKLILKNNKILKKTRIIEFLNNGNLIKIQQKDSTVKVIPIKQVKEIILLEGGLVK